MGEIPFPKEIMILENNDNIIKWRIPCFCYDKRHDWEFEVEYDKKLNDVVMFIYGDAYTKNYSCHYNWFVDRWRDISNRIRVALKVIFLGYSDYSIDIGFIGKDEILNLVRVLTAAVDKINKSKRDYGVPDETIFEKDT